MKKILTTSVILLTCILALLGTTPTQASGTSISLLNPPPGDVLVLSVGESYTFEIEIASDDPFNHAAAMPDSYYPGRGVHWHRQPATVVGNTAVIQLTVTGKSSTADLYPVCDWPSTGVCWETGTAPISIVAGVRYPKGVVAAEQFTFGIVVP